MPGATVISKYKVKLVLRKVTYADGEEFSYDDLMQVDLIESKDKIKVWDLFLLIKNKFTK